MQFSVFSKDSIISSYSLNLKLTKKFEIIFLDPPFNKNYINLLLPKIISDFSRTGTLIYIEESNFNFSDYDRELKLLKETSSGNSFGRLFEVRQ